MHPRENKKGFFTSLPKTIGLSLVISLLIIFLFGFRIGFGSYYLMICDKTSGWQNPTYAELRDFITEDQTNHQNFTGENICDVASKVLIQHARDHGYRAGYVYLDGGNISHAIVCFETTDKGLYFVEPQADVFFSYSDLEAMVTHGVYLVENQQGHMEFPLISYTINWYRTTNNPPLQFWSN